MIFIETSIFTEDVLSLLTDDEYTDFQQFLANNPLAGDVIQQTGGLRKVRSVSGGKGKREWTVVMMDNTLFERLIESMTQMNEIIDGERVPSREFVVDAIHVKSIRKKTGLTQTKFCHLIDVSLGTLRNWEQGRREPTGPAKALLRAISNDPRHVLAALAIWLYPSPMKVLNTSKPVSKKAPSPRGTKPSSVLLPKQVTGLLPLRVAKTAF